ncbi:MAG: hypothetical protein DHS20C15_07710 [Planctomycetota bacterium]|nr:MAG: hypothetical protein DHS20C15_07710 [Planctomycetota bacterium]
MKTLTLLCLSLLGLAAFAGAQTFTVTGNFQYEDKAWNYNGWNGSDPELPIRRADVFVLNAATQTVLGSGSTDATGEFSIVATSIGVADIEVRCDSDTNLNGSFQRIRAINTSGSTDYSVFSPTFNAHDTSTPLDVGTTTALKITSGGREANPFNMLDMGVDAWEYITGPLVNDTPVGNTVTVSWPGGSGSFATGSSANMAQDDGYDDAVILHELGHVIHNLYSDSDSPGGSHSFGQSNQDPQLAFGEGYATFLAGTVMIEQLNREAIYMDASGTSQSGGVGLRMRLETRAPYTNSTRGAADEVAVAAALYDLLDDETSPDQSFGIDDDGVIASSTINGLNAHRAWWDTFEGPMNSAANLTLNDAWNGWFSEHGAGGLHAEVVAAFENQLIYYSEDPDEPNEFLGDGVPIHGFGTWSEHRTFYHAPTSPPAPGEGDKDWYRFDAVVGSIIDIATRYPNGAADADTQVDTDLALWDPDDNKVAEDFDTGTGRNAAIRDFVITKTGSWQFRARSLHSYRVYGHYDYRVRFDFENFVPQITSGPNAAPMTIAEGESSSLTVTATDAQALTYTWTPLDGGTISGSGSAVTFNAPATVPSSEDFRVELVVSDVHGAESVAEIVTITVEPDESCGTPAAVTSGGMGKGGALGVPSLAAVGLPSLPNPSFALMADTLPVSSSAFLIGGLSFFNAPFDMGTMYPSPDVIFTRTTSVAGTLNVALPTLDPALCGVEIYWQVMVPNAAGASGTRQTVQTNWVHTVTGG